MKIYQKILEDVCIIIPHGRLDASNTHYIQKSLSEEAEKEGRVVMDLSSLEFLDSSGLGAIISLLRRVKKNDGDMKLVCPADKIRRVFELTRADRMFDIYDDCEVAAKSFPRGKA